LGTQAPARHAADRTPASEVAGASLPKAGATDYACLPRAYPCRHAHGANLIAGGAICRVWAPHAHSVHVIGDLNNRERNDASLLNRNDQGHWLGFIPGMRDRQRYRHLLHARPAEESGVRFSTWRARFRTSPDSALPPFNSCRFKRFRPNSALVPRFFTLYRFDHCAQSCTNSKLFEASS
jgi:hypothetical protein